jgi:hypothetical protein
MTWPAEGSDPNQQRPDPYNAPGEESGEAYQQGQPYGSAQSGGHYGPPQSGQPYGSSQSSGPQPGQPYGAPQEAPYGAQGQPYQGYPEGYGQQYGYPGYAPPARGTNVMAILSLVFAFIFAPVGIVFGHIARRQIKQTNEQGEGLATAGLIISYVLTGLYLLACVGVVIAAIATSGNSGSGY